MNIANAYFVPEGANSEWGTRLVNCTLNADVRRTRSGDQIAIVLSLNPRNRVVFKSVSPSARILNNGNTAIIEIQASNGQPLQTDLGIRLNLSESPFLSRVWIKARILDTRNPDTVYSDNNFYINFFR